MFFTGQILLLFPLHSQNAIVHKKEVMAANANLHANGARLTVPRNRIVLVGKELTENVIKKKIDDVQFPDQGLVPDRPESKSKTTFDIWTRPNVHLIPPKMNDLLAIRVIML